MRSKDAWIADARAGAAWYLAAQLADDQQARADALTKAIDSLKAALTGPGDQLRTDENAQPFAVLLAHLESQ